MTVYGIKFINVAPTNDKRQNIIIKTLFDKRSNINGLNIDAKDPNADIVPTPIPVTLIGYN